MKRLSLRPYNGELYFAKNKKQFYAAHKKIFGERSPVLTCATEGRFLGGEGPKGMWTYLVWAETPHTLAHELSHVVLEVFNRCGMDPRDSNGEPFCYLLSQLILDARLK